MIRFCVVLATASTLAALPAWADDPKTEDEKTLYSLGLALARELQVFNLNPTEAEQVKRGFADALSGKKPVVELEAYGPKIQALAQARRASQSKDFLDKAAKEKGAVKTESGLIYTSIKEGSGASPKAADTVKVHYRGTLTDGREFDSSYARNSPAEFPLGGVIKCWTEGVAKMKVGGKAKLVCPAAIAYGDRGAGNMIPPGATLVFEVELLEVKKQ
ncbi:MAG: FKBP-type peptidyl-prolyl cis-trans isomerase [Burkholderiales bacterium]|jgi:FKBP-type peptidyl-prolyl cis-trans isomerase FkpA|nr:FKBP-type peptidyl-prolyl cis-trans isomerase [Burkholderiales bacterium]